MSFKVRGFSIADKLPFLALSTNDRERGFIKNTANSSSKKDTVVYVLENDGERVGFIALSASRVDSIPAVLVDYIFIADKWRRKIISELADAKASEFLLSLAIDKAKTIQKSIGIRWLALLPDNDKLESYYIDNFGFSPYKDKTKQTYLFYKI